MWPLSTPATHTAQAPVPQASVMPLPRSQVRIVTSPAERTSTKWTLIRFGKMEGNAKELQAFVADKSIREVIKADFRGNLLILVAKGGEKVVKDLLKATEQSAKRSG